MTLQDLLIPLGINTSSQLAHKTGLSKQLCHLLWMGKTYPGWKSAVAIQKTTGLRLEHLLSLRKNEK